MGRRANHATGDVMTRLILYMLAFIIAVAFILYWSLP